MTATRKAHETHGMSYTPEYQAWKDMRNRCTHESHPCFHHYGGRGIKVHQGWLDSFVAFYADVGPRPAKGFTLERNDCNGDYAPGNVLWADWKSQQNNRRNNVRIRFGNVELTHQQWADALGFGLGVIKRRLGLGWSVAETLLTPTGKYVRRADATMSSVSA